MDEEERSRRARGRGRGRGRGKGTRRTARDPLLFVIDHIQQSHVQDQKRGRRAAGKTDQVNRLSVACNALLYSLQPGLFDASRRAQSKGQKITLHSQFRKQHHNQLHTSSKETRCTGRVHSLLYKAPAKARPYNSLHKPSPLLLFQNGHPAPKYSRKAEGGTLMIRPRNVGLPRRLWAS